MRTRKYYLVIDTETTNSLEEPLCYDVGFVVIDRLGNVYEKYSFVVKEIFNDETLMSSAYYAEKIPQYLEEIKCGLRSMATFYEIKAALTACVDKYNINIIMAHNARFDYRALNITQRYLTCSKYRYFFHYGIEIWDTLKMSREILKNNKRYIKFCKDNNYLTEKHKRTQFTAEVLYRYISKNTNFIEKHTGLDDVLIEKEIFVFCRKRNPSIDGILWERKTEIIEA